MQIDVSAEVILSQLGYSKSETSINQAEKMISSTKNFNKFSKHIFTLNDHLKKINGYVGLSNKSDYLKIKCDNEDTLEEFYKEVEHWANKYNIQLEKLKDRPIFYIVGTLS